MHAELNLGREGRERKGGKQGGREEGRKEGRLSIRCCIGTYVDVDVRTAKSPDFGGRLPIF